MNLQRFVRWCETAPSRQRAEGYAVLAHAACEEALSLADREAAAAALHLALDDPSPRVRMAVADGVAASALVPRSLVKGLLLDADDIAVRVAVSPVLTDDDLLDALAVVREPVRVAIAARPDTGVAVALAVSRLGGVASCRTLVANAAAAVPAAAFRCVAERWGGDPTMRALLLERADLPADIRQTLLLEVGYALQTSPFVAAVLGASEACRLTFDACTRATAVLAEAIDGGDMPALVDHLRTTGQLTPAFLIRIACAGNIALLAASLTALSGNSERRVRAVVVEARHGPFGSLARACGLDEAAATLLHLAVRQWKEVSVKPLPREAGDVAEFVMRRVAEAFRRMRGTRLDETSSFLRQLEGEAIRDAARSRLDLLLAA